MARDREWREGKEWQKAWQTSLKHTFEPAENEQIWQFKSYGNMWRASIKSTKNRRWRCRNEIFLHTKCDDQFVCDDGRMNKLKIRQIQRDGNMERLSNAHPDFKHTSFLMAQRQLIFKTNLFSGWKFNCHLSIGNTHSTHFCIFIDTFRQWIDAAHTYNQMNNSQWPRTIALRLCHLFDRRWVKEYRVRIEWWQLLWHWMLFDDSGQACLVLSLVAGTLIGLHSYLVRRELKVEFSNVTELILVHVEWKSFFSLNGAGSVVQ